MRSNSICRECFDRLDAATGMTVPSEAQVKLERSNAAMAGSKAEISDHV